MIKFFVLLLNICVIYFVFEWFELYRNEYTLNELEAKKFVLFIDMCLIQFATVLKYNLYLMINSAISE